MNFYEKDPEFARIFENFALNEVINEEGQELPQDIRYTAILATLLGCGGIDAFKEVLPEALEAGLPPVSVKEIIYQATAYLGIGRVLPFITAANEILEARGIALPLEGQQTVTPQNRLEKGAEAQAGVKAREIASLQLLRQIGFVYNANRTFGGVRGCKRLPVCLGKRL